jgi:peptide/nickel transport system permease protein
MFVGLGASSLDTVIALIIGIISGYFGGKVDLVLQRIVDSIIVFPNLFFYLAIMSIIGPGMGQVIFCLGFLSGVGSSRLIRSAVMGAKQNAYIDASKAIGAPNIRILLRHILPNVSAPAIIIFTIAMGSVIVAEASLSFLGFGIPPPAPSWGGMLSREARKYMTDAPWIAIFPGVALSLVVYGINMFGDAMRDLLDPRLRGGVGGLGEFGMVKARKALDKKLAKKGP